MEIGAGLLSVSGYVREPDFTTIHPRDLEHLYDRYNEGFFGGALKRALPAVFIRFSLSNRMTRAAGVTRRRVLPGGVEDFEIGIAISLLFEAFRDPGREMRVTGLKCATRLEALQRVFEHELIHLTENLCWSGSNCAAGRFQDIARRMFGHEAHTHELITFAEKARQLGVQPGAKVRFEFEGREYSGIVNRVTKRASVLVEDPNGRAFSDGRRYRTFYVPVHCLRLDGQTPGAQA
jgi:hypothetical protein